MFSYDFIGLEHELFNHLVGDVIFDPLDLLGNSLFIDENHIVGHREIDAAPLKSLFLQKEAQLDHPRQQIGMGTFFLPFKDGQCFFIGKALLAFDAGALDLIVE